MREKTYVDDIDRSVYDIRDAEHDAYRMEAGLRLRYEITRELAPYIGVSYERFAGGTAGLSRRFGEKPDLTTVVAGVRIFF